MLPDRPSSASGVDSKLKLGGEGVLLHSFEDSSAGYSAHEGEEEGEGHSNHHSSSDESSGDADVDGETEL